MNDKSWSSRFTLVAWVIVALMLVLLIRLFVLTVIQNDDWSDAANTNSEKKIYTSGTRGEILDRYGNVLAGNKHVFSVQMSRNSLSNQELNSTVSNLISLFQKNGDKYHNNFPIKLTSSGKYYFIYDRKKKDWLKSENIPENYTARQAFDYLRKKCEISEDATDTEAQIEMQNTYNKYPEISILNMQYTADVDKEAFLERYDLKEDISAEKAFKSIRKYMGINQPLSEKKAYKIMVIRNELESMGYMTYMPAVIAKDVSNQTIVTIEEESAKYKGVEISSETKRYYPNNKSAAHILGYLGSISEGEKEEYVGEKGYQSSDLIGKEGIEGTYEDVLRGKDGVKTVQVDSSGNMTKVISETAPEKGSDVYLTIDLKLQKTLEKALEKGVKCTRYGGTYVDNYGNYGYSRCYPNCKSGAAVAIDVKTGDVLAMASYPSYNPNLFAEGITDKDWAKVQSENARDPLAAAPLYNIAAKCAVQPGSTFKPVTATAALSKGWSPEAYLTDAGAINIGNDKFGCWLYNQYGSTHGSINLRTAIETSCNYYFFDVATGKDWASGGASLGYSLDIDEIMKFAKQYGLGEKTGIEISETVAPTTSAENKLNSMRTQLRYNLEANAEEYFEKSVYNDIGELEGQIDEIVSWIEKNYDRRETIDKLGKLGIKKNKIEKLADLLVYTYFIQSEWNIGDQFNIAIGQGSNAYTPLQMANYLATIGNSGKHNTVSVVESVENQGHTKKEKASSVEISSGNLEAIVDGMTRVCHGSQGSVYDVFKNFDIKCAGKTGTAERSGKINPENEINYLKKHLGSFSSSLTWKQVEKEIKRLMDKYPDIYTSREDAARRAVMNLAKISSETMDQYKSDYENFAWLICMAPADDPKIAVSVLLVQGGESLYAGPIAREIIGEYLKVKKTYGEDYKIDAGER